MNKKLFYIYSLIKEILPIYPIYLLLFKSDGLALSQISMLLAIWCIPAIFLEIPTGILSDIWSRKKMFVIAACLNTLCMVFWYFSDGFWMYALGFISWGISGAFESGTVEALLYDSLILEKEEHLFDKIYGRGNLLSGISIAFSMAAGGFLATWLGMDVVLIISFAATFSVVIISFRFKEVNLFKEAHGKSRFNFKDSLSTFRNAAKLCVTNKGVLLSFLIVLLVLGAAQSLDEFDPLVAQGQGLKLGMIGIWGAGRMLMDAAGSGLAYTIKKGLQKIGISDDFTIIATVGAAGSICLVSASLLNGLTFIPFYGLFFLLMASGYILFEDYLQKQISSEGRATVHSLTELIQNAFGFLFFAILSAVLSKVSVIVLLGIVGLSISVSSFIIYLYYRKMVKPEGVSQIL